VREVLLCGGPSAGKTSALIASALQYVHVPEYHAALFVHQPIYAFHAKGALVDRTWEWVYDAANADGKKPVWHSDRSAWRFPSGAELHLAALSKPNDHLRFGGSIFHFVGFDNLEDFSRDEYLYLSGRARAHGSKVPLRVRATTIRQNTPLAAAWITERFFANHPDRLLVMDGQSPPDPKINFREFL
jgi:hypothetical protein